jgi:abnormal spindle-like microcephaly-associated protein
MFSSGNKVIQKMLSRHDDRVCQARKLHSRVMQNASLLGFASLKMNFRAVLSNIEVLDKASASRKYNCKRHLASSCPDRFLSISAVPWQKGITRRLAQQLQGEMLPVTCLKKLKADPQCRILNPSIEGGPKSHPVVNLSKEQIRPQSIARMQIKRIKSSNMTTLLPGSPQCGEVHEALITSSTQHLPEGESRQVQPNISAVQTSFRGRITRRLQNQKVAAVAIQSHWRYFFVRQRFKRARKAAIVLQRCARRTVACRWILQRKRLDDFVASAAFLMQSTYRGYQGRKQMQFLHFSATKIQTAWRHLVAVSDYAEATSAVQVHPDYDPCLQIRTIPLSATRIQTAWRGCLTANAGTETSNSAAILLQSVYRGNRSRKQVRLLHSSAITIQTFWRGLLHVLAHVQASAVAVRVQSLYRGYQSRKQVELLHLYATRIQTSWRGLVAIIAYYAASSAMRIQAWYRGCRSRQQSQLRHCSGSERGQTLRGCLYIPYRVEMLDIVTCQSFIRRWLAKRYFSELVAISCRDSSRANKQARPSQFLLLKPARSNLAPEQRNDCDARESAACIIQKVWRCYTIHVEYLIMLLGAMELQALVRGVLARRRFSHESESIVRLQSAYRGFYLRRHQKRKVLASVHASVRNLLLRCRRQQNSARRIQRSWRLRHARRHLRIKSRSVVIIQHEYDSASICHEVLKSRLQNVATVRIQACYRAYRSLHRIGYLHVSATKIQSAWRGYSTGLMFGVMVFCALKIQRIVRVSISENRRFVPGHRRQSCQTVHRTAENRLSAKGTIAEITPQVVTIQGLVRGLLTRNLVRKQMRLVAAPAGGAGLKAEASPATQLSSRTKAALSTIQTRSSFSEIMAAMHTLEVTTRFSRRCCSVLVNFNATRILLDVCRQCNQSLPHVNLLTCILHTMKNIANHEKLLPFVATASTAEVMLDLLQIFRTKESIFGLSISLLEMCITRDCKAKVSELHCAVDW